MSHTPDPDRNTRAQTFGENLRTIVKLARALGVPAGILVRDL